MVWREALLVTERQNREMANNAILFQMAASAAFNGKQAFNQFKKRIEDLMEGEG